MKRPTYLWYRQTRPKTLGMGRRFGRRLCGRVLQILGAGLIAAALIGAAAAHVSMAAPIRLGGPSPSPLPLPSPAAGMSASPTPGPQLVRGGPLQFDVSGSLSLGSQFQTSANDVAANAYDLSQVDESVGLMAELRRSTGRSTTDLRIPLGFSNGGSTIGTSVLSYTTPQYALAYGSESLSLYGQLPIGSTLRGPSIALPFGAGDVTFFAGPGLGVANEVVHAYGVRARRAAGSSVYELGLLTQNGGSLTGSAQTAIVGVVTTRGLASLIAEASVQHRQTPTGNVSGAAFAARLDTGNPNADLTVSFRHVPDRFLVLGGGESSLDTLLDASYHRSSQRGTFSADEALESSGFLGDTTSQRRSLLAYSGAFGSTGSYAVTLQESRTAGVASPATWSGLTGIQIGANALGGYDLLGMQIGRTTQIGAAPIGLVGYSAQFQRQFRKLSFTFGGQMQRQSNSALGLSRLTVASAGVARNFGRTTLGTNYAISHTQSIDTDALQRTSQFVIGRQISPVINVQVQYSMQHLTDALNPSSNGHSHSFGVQINAPFAFGNGIVQGRVDPRLPAIISGTVTTDLGASQAGYFGAQGVGNVAVILDGITVARTDLAGNFQFNFVSPGTHQIRVESSSLPRGLTVDQPVVSINVQGGQTGTVAFRIGSFGAIAGHVYGRGSDGALVPLQNVLLRVDGGTYSQTDSSGAYGFGRLQPGDHTVTVIEQSVPAFAAFDPTQLARKIGVQNGQITNLDFTAQPLGSIGGRVMFAAELAPIYKGAVNNAYVVAEPGDYAAITGEDGTFLLDDLPPGTYTLSIDPETVPDDTGQIDPPAVVTLGSREHNDGLLFHIGHAVKKVVFSFLGGGAKASVAPQLHLSEPKLPPKGAAEAFVDAPVSVAWVTLEAFGLKTNLVYDRAHSAWAGFLRVPPGVKAGKYEVSAQVADEQSPLDALLVVDPRIPLVTLHMTPASAKPGDYVTVRARFLVDARPGDRIAWEDGTFTTLGRPVSGRVFTFNLRISLRPLHGVLLTKSAKVPIQLR